jgi:stage II sporulation protein AA (anti-sigma F factor antagonist)
MAANFEISVDKKSEGFGLNLVGDFDATSAYELIYAIKKLPEDIVKISIHTDGLKNLSPFGLDVFHKNMSPLDYRSRKIVFTGNKASHISPGDPRPAL